MPGDLYYGDNLDVMRRHVASESIDLIYLDPPFNSDRTYNLLHKGSQAQERAFVDTWTWDDASENAYRELTDRIPTGVHVPRPLTEMLVSLKSFLQGHRDMLAYLSMMAIRLVEMKRILKKTGSLYLHCDPTASHYLKLILDLVFDPENFRNEIVWRRSQPKGHASIRFPRSHDVVFFYVKSEHAKLRKQFVEHDPDYVEKFYRFTEPSTGRRYQLGDATNPNKDRPNLTYEFPPGSGMTRVWRWTKPRMMDAWKRGEVVVPEGGGVPRVKRYLDEMKGSPVTDLWLDIEHLHGSHEEATGYPTQKPKALLTRIIEASSDRGDLVLDPFCGCGTTIEVAEELGRKWIGIDIAIRAVNVIKDRLDEKYQPRVWTEHGEPADVEQAAHLAETNQYDFQWWAVRQLGGSPPKGEKKKGADGGIDGEVTLFDDAGKARRGIVSVKGGHILTPDFVKALKSTVDLEKADFGVLVTMHEPSKGMRDVARDFGSLAWADDYGGKVAHKIRIVTVPEMMARSVAFPGRVQAPRTRSSPPPPEARQGETLHLPFPARPSTAKARSKRGKALKPSDIPPKVARKTRGA